MNDYQNNKAEIAMPEVTERNEWRFGGEWPPLVGNKGDGLSLVLLFVSIPGVAIFGSFVFYAVAIVFVLRNYARYKKMKVSELITSPLRWLAPDKSGCSSIRQKRLLSVVYCLFALNLVNYSPRVHAVEIIRAIPVEQLPQKNAVLGEFFINNVDMVPGHGTVTLDSLLNVLVTAKHDYKIIYNDSELEKMIVTWRSLPPRTMTLDQVLGSLSVRYGIYFFTPRGASEMHVAWLRDEEDCVNKNNGVYIALCGVDLGRY